MKVRVKRVIINSSENSVKVKVLKVKVIVVKIKARGTILYSS